MDSLHRVEGRCRLDRLVRNEKLLVLAAWFDPNENRTHARFSKAGVLAADLVAAGKGDVPLEVVSFQSSAHPKTFLKRCKTVREAVDNFFAALDAKPRDLAVIETIGGLELQDIQGRAFHVDELDGLCPQNPAADRVIRTYDDSSTIK